MAGLGGGGEETGREQSQCTPQHTQNKTPQFIVEPLVDINKVEG